jgi:hypothetical protein
MRRRANPKPRHTLAQPEADLQDFAAIGSLRPNGRLG